MILHGTRLLQGYGRSTPGMDDQNVPVIPQVIMTNPAVSPTSIKVKNFTTPQVLLASQADEDSVCVDFFETRANQAASNNFFLALAKGLWEIHLQGRSWGDYQPVVTENNALLMFDRTQSVNLGLIRHRFQANVQFETAYSFTIALTEVAFFQASLTAAGVGQTQSFEITMICNRRQ